MSSLQMPGSRVDIGRIPEMMYADARLRGWFRRTPEHLGALTGYGVGVLLAGLVVTAVLAVSIGNAMIGVAVCGVGAVCALARTLLPIRTARGHLLVAHVAALRHYLSEFNVDDLAPADRELVLTRAAPYAVVLGQLGPWLTAMGRLDTAADGTPGIDWYDTASSDTANLPAFLTALDGVLARGAHLRNLP